MPTLIQEFIDYIEKSPTVYHAAKETGNYLAENDFEPINEREAWKLKPQANYFTMRDQAAVLAFSLPKKKPKRALILASHLDSPCLKIKPNLKSHTEHHHLLDVEVYGSPLLSSWLSKDLAIAGRVLSEKGLHLVNLDGCPTMIAQLAIHLNKTANEKGSTLNRQDHLKPLFALEPTDIFNRLSKQYAFKNLYSYDLFLYPLQKPTFLGPKSEMLASSRLDNLTSAYATLHALLSAKKDQEETLYINVFWDHEEIGSQSQSGAQSSFLLDSLKRICGCFQMDNEEFFMLKNSSFCISCDATHAYHPNYPEKYDPAFAPILGKGVAIKYNAQHKYTSTAISSYKIKKIAQESKIPLQSFVSRSDMNTGSTVGPFMSSILGMHTVDIGVPLLSMHSSREIIAMNDQIDLCKLLLAAIEKF